MRWKLVPALHEGGLISSAGVTPWRTPYQALDGPWNEATSKAHPIRVRTRMVIPACVELSRFDRAVNSDCAGILCER